MGPGTRLWSREGHMLAFHLAHAACRQIDRNMTHLEPHSACTTGTARPSAALTIVGYGPSAVLLSLVAGDSSSGGGVDATCGSPAGAGVPYRRVWEWPPAEQRCAGRVGGLSEHSKVVQCVV